jgi:hypothetical protein
MVMEWNHPPNLIDTCIYGTVAAHRVRPRPRGAVHPRDSPACPALLRHRHHLLRPQVRTLDSGDGQGLLHGRCRTPLHKDLLQLQLHPTFRYY